MLDWDFVAAFYWLGSSPSPARQTSIDSQLTVEEYCVFQHLWYSGSFVRCNNSHGVVLQSVVSAKPVTSQHFCTNKDSSFQEVQHLSALQTGLRIIPSLVVGVILNFTTGLFVDRVPALWLVTGSSVICSISPLLMAAIKVQSPYWTNAFIAQLLSPVSTDVLFTVGLIIISDNFPDDTQALAGAVFNTASQFGQALVLGIMQIVSTVVTKDNSGKSMPMAVMEGLRASFWTMFGLMMVCTLWGAVGLRKTGKVGLKRD